jgi:hypothetical protein
VQNFGKKSFYTHCRALGFLASPYLVVSGNAKRMLHMKFYTSGEISGSLFYSVLIYHCRIHSKKL